VVGRTSGRRIVFELLVVGWRPARPRAARAGVAAASTAGTVRGFDPFIAAVPALVGVAAGIVVVRLYPIVLGAAAAVARRGRGLVPMLAARRATEGGASSAVLLVLLATATVGAFAASSLDSLGRGADAAAWHEVGGSYRLQGPTGALRAASTRPRCPGSPWRPGCSRATCRSGSPARRRCS
jgi:putative ABC transport system permease protein